MLPMVQLLHFKKTSPLHNERYKSSGNPDPLLDPARQSLHQEPTQPAVALGPPFHVVSDCSNSAAPALRVTHIQAATPPGTARTWKSKHKHQIFFWNMGINTWHCNLFSFPGWVCTLALNSLSFSVVFLSSAAHNHPLLWFQPFLLVTFSFPATLPLGPLPSCVTGRGQVD